MLRSYFDFVLTIAHPDLILSVPDDALATIMENDDFQSLLAGQVALLGAIDAAKTNADVDRARDLLDVAFLELNKARVALRRHGLWLTPFPNETPDQRGARAIRYAERIRDALSEADMQALEGSLLRDLR